MRRPLVLAALVAAVFPAALTAQQAAKNPQMVGFLQVNEDRDARTAAFRRFLEQRFAGVKVVEPGGDPQSLAGLDVVLVDWDQSADGRWRSGDGGEPQHPLGARDAWQTPLVLLGSAGLNTAVAWNVHGGIG